MDQPKRQKLYRSESDKIIAGVSGGLGDYFGVDPVVIRVIFVALCFAGGSGIILYLILALIIPNEHAVRHVPDPARTAEQANSPAESFVSDLRDSAEHFADRVKHNRYGRARPSYWVGTLIIIVGVLLLLQEFLPTIQIHGEVIWAVIIIFVGISLLTRGHGK